MLEFTEISEAFPRYHKDARKANWKRKCKFFWNKIKAFFGCKNSKTVSKLYSEKINETNSKKKLSKEIEESREKLKKDHEKNYKNIKQWNFLF